MEGSQTPPPGSGGTPPPPEPAGAQRQGDDDRAGVGFRIGAVVLFFALAIICAVAAIVMADVGDKGVCSEVRAQSGLIECYDFSESVKPIVLAAGWAGAVLAAIAALLSLAYAVRGRGGRILVATTITAATLLIVSIAIAQVN